MLTVSRRGLFALGGTGAAAVLAGCGTTTDERDDADEQTVLDSAMQAEINLQSAYDNTPGGVAAGRAGADVLNRCRENSSKRQSELGRLGASLPQGSGGSSGGAGFDSTEAAANAAIAAYRQGARLLGTPEQRAVCTAFLAQVAAELAAIRGLAGEDQAPVAFVTGSAQEPLEAAETTTTSTTSTSTTSTSTGTQ